MEVWKTIEGYTDYQISNYGNIKSFKNKKEKILNPQKSQGYFYTTLSFNKKVKQFRLHRLVALHFISNTDNKLEVNHIDGNKQNNRVDNLEWVTKSENEKHAFKIGLKNLKGENNNHSIFKENEVLAIHGLYLSGMNQFILSKLYNTNPPTISKIINGKRWNHLIYRNGVI